ncbi:hypothetical protein LBMAG42_30240 [Deltaproteobacteria bacterium]|nr:hypothetical protein LBMAG42_30240 [Deltaproteobacteria bacterium]
MLRRGGGSDGQGPKGGGASPRAGAPPPKGAPKRRSASPAGSGGLSGAEALAAKVEQIRKTTGVPLETARLVALGRLDLNDAIKRMAFADEVTSLMARHELDRALATQVALGHADLQKALRKRRVDALIQASMSRDILETAAKSGAELVLGVHGRQLLRARITEITAYDVHLLDLEKNEASILHKTRLKFACEAAPWQKARKAMVWDSARKLRTVEPITRPQDRFGCSNRRLGEALDRNAETTITLLEGEVFTGHLAWVARWEVGLRTKGGDVAIFRHAIDDFRD